MEQHGIQCKTVDLQVYTKGTESASTIVFLHGDSGAGSQWFPVMTQLCTCFRTVTFDQRGHGASAPAKDGAYSYSVRANDLNELASNNELENFVLVAHSGAAGTALEYAATHPSRVSGIFLLDPATDPRAMPEEMRMEFLSAVRSDEGLGIVQGYYTSISGQNPDTIAAVMADAAKVSKPARVGVTEALLGWDPQTAITAWNGRLKIVITPPNNTPASLRFLIEQADVELLSTNGHWPHLDDPDLISRLINLFVSELN